MTLARLELADFRNIPAAELVPGPEVNWLRGENGAGKTSVLEAIHLLARGRSFRSPTLLPLIREDCPAMRVVAETAAGDRLGVERGRGQWRGRINGADCTRVSEFAVRLPLVLVEPGSHQLVEGPPARRRAYLDWALFHVEPDYLAVWRRYARLLRQRNAALKAGAAPAVLDSLETPMSRAAEAIDRLRRQQVAQLVARIPGLAESLGLRFAPPEPGYREGHDPDRDLAETLASARERDREAGHTRHGPHRAELRLLQDGKAIAPRLSRGQQKLCSLVLLLALLDQYRDAGLPALLLLDDPVSELDREHLSRLVAWLGRSPVQSWVTAVAPPPEAAGTMFHVEQGQITAMV